MVGLESPAVNFLSNKPAYLTRFQISDFGLRIFLRGSATGVFEAYWPRLGAMPRISVCQAFRVKSEELRVKTEKQRRRFFAAPPA